MYALLDRTRALPTRPATPGLSRRRVLAVAGSVAASAAWVAACAPAGQGGGGDAAGAPQKRSVSLRYTTFWTQQRLDVIAPAIKQFEEETGHRVSMEPVTNYAEKLVVEFVSGTAADAPHANNTVMPKLFDQGMVLDLTRYVNRDKINVKRDYGLMGQEFWDGKILTMPYVLSPHAWYYNKTMLKEAGAPDPWERLNGQLTWEDMLTIARATTRPAQGDRPQRWGIWLGYDDIEYQLAGFIWSNGGRAHDYATMKYTMDQPKSIEAVQWVYDLLNKHKVMLSLRQVQELADAGLRHPFQDGRAALFENSTGQLQPLGPVKDFEWDVFPIPRVSRNGPAPVTYTSGDPNCVNAATDKKDEAWLFVKWLAGPTVQHLIGRTKLLTPALIEATADAKGYAAPPPAHIKVFADVFKGKVTRRFFHHESQQGLTIFRNWIRKAFDGEIAVEQALREATREANQIISWKTKPTFPE
jgi:multiple sugar transport system substrate-binding protein